jgi:CBS domain containing-hemolysin-like protein
MLNLAIAILIMLLGSASVLGHRNRAAVGAAAQGQTAGPVQKPAAVALYAIRQKINRPIATIVILNNLFNIVGSIVIGSIAAKAFGDAMLGVFSGLLTFSGDSCWVKFCPKPSASATPSPLHCWWPSRCSTLTWVFTPIVWLLEKITEPLHVSVVSTPSPTRPKLSSWPAIGHQEGIIEADEAEMIRRVFRLNDMKSVNIMTPRVAVTHLPGDLTIAAAQDTNSQLPAQPYSGQRQRHRSDSGPCAQERATHRANSRTRVISY